MVKIIPYSTSYFEGVIDVLQYIWDANENCRSKRFLWEYCQNPNSNEVLAVIAIDKNEKVVGFIGWVAGDIKTEDDNFCKVVRAADVVVNPSSRRQGVFEKMTIYSAEYLKEKKIHAIINLSANKYSIPGCKKLEWEDLSLFDIWYRINVFSLKKKRFIPSKINYKDSTIEIFNKIPSALVLPKQTTKRLSFVLTGKELMWLFEKPNVHHIGACSVNKSGILTSLFILNETNNKYLLKYFYASDSKIASRVFNEMTKRISYRFISVWAFALPKEKRDLLRKLRFHSIGYKKLRKKPPVLIKTLLTSENGREDWIMGGLDMRNIENWEINLIDAF